MSKAKLPLTEELDFAYLLALMPPLHAVEEFAWLPELFSIVGHEKLIQLCKYCGGEQIQIPTLAQLTDSIEALQWFYDVYITKKKPVTDIPIHLCMLTNKICDVYEGRNAGQRETDHIKTSR